MTPSDRRADVAGGGALDLALDVLAALSAAGLAVVPVEPTHEMVRAGAAAGDVDEAKAAAVFAAMLTAAE